MKPHHLRTERELRGWSQAKVAKLLNTTIRSVSRWEQGLAIPSPYYREQLCTLFGKSARQLGMPSDAGENDVELEALSSVLLPSSSRPPHVSAIVPSSPPHVSVMVPSSPSASVRQESFLVDPAIPKMLNNAASLLGRAGLLAQVKQRLFEGDSLALTALNGLPGIGKTALAVALAMDQQVQAHFCDGILWAGLGLHPNRLGLLTRWGKLLGVVPSEVENSNSREVWSQALRVAISNRRMLLVIDDAWSAEDALALQVGGARCAHLLTTRLPPVAFAFAQQGAIVVPELQEADGLALLARFVPKLVQQDPAGAQTLVRAVGSLPLALTLMGKYLGAQAFTRQPRRMEAALAQLYDAKHRLGVSVPISLGERSPSLPEHIPLSLHAAIAISDQQLSPQAHATLCALSVFSPKPNSFSEEAALVVSQQPVEMLDALWDAGLLESCGPARYTLHQTIADYARTQAKDQLAQQRLVSYMLAYIQAHKHNYEALEREASNILGALEASATLGMSPECSD